MINNTLNYLLAQKSDLLLTFSDQTSGISTYIHGGGTVAGDGFPLPKAGHLLRIDCWDGSTLHSGDGSVELAQGDRISVYAQVNGSYYDVYVRVNGINSELHAASVPLSAPLMVTVHIVLGL